MGPVCRGYQHFSRRKNKDKGQAELFDNHAVFEIVNGSGVDNAPYVYIIDRGNGNNCKTVTNDAAWVVQELDDLIEGFENKRLFYMDSDGRIDEILHNGNHFTTFKAGHEGVEL
jgi:hypothetical protein